jgi:hypothetical protein
VDDPDRRPTLIVNPADDRAFRAAADRLIESGLLEPTLLQDCLREQWPRAIVRPRELAGEHAQIWYVYRDGHWIHSSVEPGPAA